MNARSPFPQLQIIVAAQLMSLAMFVGVAWFITEGAEAPPGPQLVPQVLAIVGVLPLGLSSFVQRAMLRSQHRRLSVQGGSDAQWGQSFFTAVVLGTALRESTGIFGLVISILTGDPFWAAAYAAIAAVGIGLSFPTPERFERWRRSGA